MLVSLAQVSDNGPSIELGTTTFPIERPFAISVIIPNSETRATVHFPDIDGFTKKGILTSTTSSEVAGENVVSQVITQNYQARAPGRFRLPPFKITVNDKTVESEGAILVVQPAAGTQNVAGSQLTTKDITPNGAAFLSLRTSKNTIFSGEGVAMTLSFFVADNYPYVLNFVALDRQLQVITKKIRPTNAWEENLPINDLKPIPVTIKGKKFREFRLYQSVFFPLSNQSLRIPSVSLQLARPRPVIGPPSPKTDMVTFANKPVQVTVKLLPKHPLRGRVPVGEFRLEESLERQHMAIGKSVRYAFTIAGEGNIATLSAPTLLNPNAELDIFPPEERHTINHNGHQITGQKTFTYFLVPHQNGSLPLANRFQWIYFDPKKARYDTLLPQFRLQVGGGDVAASGKDVSATNVAGINGEAPLVVASGNSLYAGIETMDSTQQSIPVSALIRAVANVLIIIMLLGMIVVFIRK
ncbi:BatD family protein [Spirosoma profusum]|uniref:BatD family protein n=1 Tax=Spirosoma profusum TaxID=2771354 RepID=UPI00293C0C10|nr:BatD family protein [Spirosoma profusum]